MNFGKNPKASKVSLFNKNNSKFVNNEARNRLGTALLACGQVEQAGLSVSMACGGD